MRPPVSQDGLDVALLQKLRTWCGTGATPRMTEPLTVASIAPLPGLDAAACEMDGSHALARMSRWQGLAWRLQIMARDHLAYRPHQNDPWDCGWWREGPVSTAADFRPRRATLLLVDEPGKEIVEALLATLRAESLGYSRPVRVLLVGGAPMGGMPTIRIASRRAVPEPTPTFG